MPKLMKQFEKFHSENGVRTVMGNIGSVKNGEQQICRKEELKLTSICLQFAQYECS